LDIYTDECPDLRHDGDNRRLFFWGNALLLDSFCYLFFVAIILCPSKVLSVAFAFARCGSSVLLTLVSPRKRVKVLHKITLPVPVLPHGPYRVILRCTFNLTPFCLFQLRDWAEVVIYLELLSPFLDSTPPQFGLGFQDLFLFFRLHFRINSFVLPLMGSEDFTAPFPQFRIPPDFHVPLLATGIPEWPFFFMSMFKEGPRLIGFVAHLEKFRTNPPTSELMMPPPLLCRRPWQTSAWPSTPVVSD